MGYRDYFEYEWTHVDGEDIPATASGEYQEFKWDFLDSTYNFLAIDQAPPSPERPQLYINPSIPLFSSSSQECSLRVSIASAGALLFDGTKSFAGHMFFTISCPIESTKGWEKSTYTFDFSPAKGWSGWPIAPGQVNANGDADANYRPEFLVHVMFGITPGQAEAAKSFGENPFGAEYGFSSIYNALSNSCVDFVWRALKEAGLNPANFEGAVLPSNNIDILRQIDPVTGTAREMSWDFLAHSSFQDLNPESSQALNYGLIQGLPSDLADAIPGISSPLENSFDNPFDVPIKPHPLLKKNIPTNGGPPYFPQY